MTWLDRILAKPHKVLLWAFTGLIISSTVYTLLESPKGLESKKKKSKAQTPKTAEEIERDSRDVSTWSKKELFEYLSRHSVYPDVDIPRDELFKLVNSIKNLYPDIDY